MELELRLGIGSRLELGRVCTAAPGSGLGLELGLGSGIGSRLELGRVCTAAPGRLLVGGRPWPG